MATDQCTIPHRGAGDADVRRTEGMGRLFIGIPFGRARLHKFYLRQPVLGCIYFFTGGPFILGWLYDLATLPDQVNHCNAKLSSGEDLEELLEEEIEELEDEITLLENEIVQLKSTQMSTQMSTQGKTAI